MAARKSFVTRKRKRKRRIRRFRTGPAYWRAVFRRVISAYFELKSTNGTSSCSRFYKLVSAGRSSARLHNPRILRTSVSDFIADVELAATRALRWQSEKWVLYRSLYVENKEEEEVKATFPLNFLELKHSVQEQVGKMFLRRKIYPVGAYFAPTYL